MPLVVLLWLLLHVFFKLGSFTFSSFSSSSSSCFILPCLVVFPPVPFLLLQEPPLHPCLFMLMLLLQHKEGWVKLASGRESALQPYRFLQGPTWVQTHNTTHSENAICEF